MKTFAGLQRTAQSSSSLLLRNHVTATATTLTSNPVRLGNSLFSNTTEYYRYTRQHDAASFSTTTNARQRYNEPPAAAKAATPSLSDQCRSVMRQLPHPVVVITTMDYPDNNRSIPAHWSESEREAANNDYDNKNGTTAIRPIPRAMTVSSFTSLTLKPEPRVMFNVTLPSRTHSAIVRNGWFNVHILSGDEYGARVADALTRGSSSSSSSSTQQQKPNLGILAELTRYGIDVDLPGSSSSNEVVVRGGGGAAPLLRGRGIVRVLRCEVHTPRHIQLLLPLAEEEGDGSEEDDEHKHYTLVIARVREVVEGQGQGEDNVSSSKNNDNNNNEAVALGYVHGAYRRAGKPVLRHTLSSSVDDGKK